MSRTPRSSPHGPLRADQLRPGDPYELDNGHPVYCAPVGARGASATHTGALVLASDPKVDSSGIETGFAPEPGTLWAPDIAVGNVGDEPGWVKGVPALAVEYADSGQDEVTLRTKIADLLARGTLVVWVVRLAGPRRVEVHERGKEPRAVASGGVLEAPELLANAVAVEALYDRGAALDATLRNLLQRRGYADLDEVREEGRGQGRDEGRDALRVSLRSVLAARGLATTEEDDAVIAACRESAQLSRWIVAAVTAASVGEVLGG